MSKLNPMSAEALVAQANKLGLRIYTDQLFDSLQALSAPNRILNIEHKATRVMVAGDIQSRIEIYRFLTGWETEYPPPPNTPNTCLLYTSPSPRDS